MPEKYYIFGAHSRARTLAVYLKNTNVEVSIVAFLTDNNEWNPDEIDGIPVLCPYDILDENKSYPVYLAVRGVNQGPVEERLRKTGFSNIIPVTVSLDAELRKRYFRKVYKDKGRQFILIDDLEKKCGDFSGDIIIYEVGSIFDKPLEKDHYVRKQYEIPIQVGAALTDERIEGCYIFDNTGDNISETNKQLCEETALYWMWKNSSESVIGLEHYRRHFIMPDDWIERMVGNSIDVILPIPIYVGPSVEENYRFRHDSADWDCMMQVIQEQSSSEYDFACKCFGNSMYFPLNIFVMRRDALNEYCSWLFPKLFEVMRRIGEHEDSYQNRYPAFMAERLLTLYFEMNRNKYNIVYADKGFLQ